MTNLSISAELGVLFFGTQYS